MAALIITSIKIMKFKHSLHIFLIVKRSNQARSDLCTFGDNFSNVTFFCQNVRTTWSLNAVFITSKF